MKHLKISIDLEDNELFEESVKEAVLGYARQIIREEMNNTIVAEIHRIVAARVSELKESPYYSMINSKVVERVTEKISKNLTYDYQAIAKIIEDKVEAHVEQRLKGSYMRGGIEEFIESYLDKSLAKVLAKKAGK